MKQINKMLPFALPDIGQEEIDEVVHTLSSGWLTTGPKAERLESDFSEFIGSDHALAVNSATAGLHLALDACGIGPGDKVVTTPYTFTATAEVIHYLGAEPLFADIDPKTLTLDPQCLERIVEAREDVKAVIPVHFAGQACDMDAILSVAEKHALKVVEDAAHALPTTYGDRLVGNIGDLTVFSFYATKTLSTGEGGMVVTNNPDYADRIRIMRLHGINRTAFDRVGSGRPAWYYEVTDAGFKYNMPDIAAAIGIHQLKKANTFQKRRCDIAEKYTHAFSGLPLAVPRPARPGDTHAWHLYVIQLDLARLSIDRDRFIELAAEAGVQTSVHFIPLHLQPYWRDRYGFKPDDFPVCRRVFQRVVSLPIYSGMTDGDVDFVIQTVRRILLAHVK